MKNNKWLFFPYLVNLFGSIFIEINIRTDKMNDDELTKLAVAQLLAEAEQFKRRHELQYKLVETARLKPNLRYFNNTLKNCISSNVREERLRRSKAADELKHLDNQVKKVKADEEIVESATEKPTRIDPHCGPENIYSYDFKKKATFKTRKKDSRLKPNIKYFKKALENCVSSNFKKERLRTSKASNELKHVDHQEK